jgi:hypothetical protein
MTENQQKQEIDRGDQVKDQEGDVPDNTAGGAAFVKIFIITKIIIICIVALTVYLMLKK